MDEMTPVNRPNGARCTVMLTFDFDPRLVAGSPPASKQRMHGLRRPRC
jgi:hypothetical protein